MPIPTTTPYDYPSMLPVERTRLLELLRGIDEAAWDLPTPCPAWSVHDLANHLLGVDLSVIAWHRDAHRGPPSPAGADEAGFIAWLDQLQLDWVFAARRMSPRLTIELLDQLAPATAEVFAGQDPTSPALVTWASDAPVPLWLDHAGELTEQWIHRQQLLEAVGRPSDLRADLAGPVLEALRWAYPYRLAQLQRPAGAAVRIRVVDDTLGADWTLAASDEWSFAPTDAEPIATMTLSAEQAWRLLTNNYRSADHGPIEVAGDPEITETLIRTRAIIGEPH